MKKRHVADFTMIPLQRYCRELRGQSRFVSAPSVCLCVLIGDWLVGPALTGWLAPPATHDLVCTLNSSCSILLKSLLPTLCLWSFNIIDFCDIWVKLIVLVNTQNALFLHSDHATNNRQMLCCWSPRPRTGHLFSEVERRENQRVHNQEAVQHVAGDRLSEAELCRRDKGGKQLSHEKCAGRFIQAKRQNTR